MNFETLKIQVLNVIIGLLFLSAGMLKAVDSQYFASLIASYGFGWAGYLAPVISGTEIILGVMFLIKLEIRMAAWISILLTTIFTVVFAYAYFAKGIDDCGCFGSFQRISPALSFVKNVFIILASVYVFFSTVQSQTAKRDWKRIVLLVVACFAFYTGGYSLGKPLIEKNKLKVGDALHSSAFRFFASDKNPETMLIFVFSPDCPHCWNVTENVKSIKRMTQFNNTIGVTFPNSDLSLYTSAMNPNFDIFQYPTAELGESITEVPMLIVAQHGIISRIYSSDEIPCGKMLELAIAR